MRVFKITERLPLPIDLLIVFMPFARYQDHRTGFSGIDNRGYSLFSVPNFSNSLRADEPRKDLINDGVAVFGSRVIVC